MINTIKDILKGLRKGKNVSSLIANPSHIVLSIRVNGKDVAFLSFDDAHKEFCLKYTENFEKSGLTPFHASPTEIVGTKIDVNKVYKSSLLWYPFASRIPNPEREDYEAAMANAGLSVSSPTLEVIGKLSKYSISKPWNLEISNNNSLSCA
ncbi:MAG: hypothetical protein K2Q18_18030 [Bdellovibrionales bacterium]|nr:hypothetical protein [Bdellovibrionales bacterium]